MKKKGRKAQVKKLDIAFSLKVRAIGICELAGKDTVRCGGVLQCAHIVTRGRKALRWDIMNALSLCAGHHVFYTNNPQLWNEIVAFFFPEKHKYVEEHKNDIWDKNLEVES